MLAPATFVEIIFAKTNIVKGQDQSTAEVAARDRGTAESGEKALERFYKLLIFMRIKPGRAPGMRRIRGGACAGVDYL
jgi:hypothetical protein